MNFTASVSDNVGVTSCTLYDGTATLGTMSVNVGTAAYTASLSAGTHNLEVRCSDAAGNVATSATTVTASPPSTVDTTPPTVSGISPTSAIAGQMTVFSAVYGDNVWVSQCTIFDGNAPLGPMTLGSNGSATFSTALNAGTHAIQVQCKDSSENLSQASQTTVNVSANGAVDTTPPYVSEVYQSQAIVGSMLTLSVNASDNAAVSSCELYLNAVDSGSMNVGAGEASVNYTFSVAGTYSGQDPALGRSNRPVRWIREDSRHVDRHRLG
jgi:hypothetical protein